MPPLQPAVNGRQKCHGKPNELPKADFYFKGGHLMQWIPWSISIIVFVISIVTIIVKLAQLQTQQNAMIAANSKSIIELQVRLDSIERTRRPSEVCDMKMNQMGNEIEGQKKKLSEQISRNIDSERQLAVMMEKLTAVLNVVEKIDRRMNKVEGGLHAN